MLMAELRYRHLFSPEKQKRLAEVNTSNEALLTYGNDCVVTSFAFGRYGEAGACSEVEGRGKSGRCGDCSRLSTVSSRVLSPKERLRTILG